MKVEIEKKPDSVSTLQIELPPEEVRKEWDSIANDYARYARIPGYRPGRAPRQVIEKKFRKEIQEELTKKLISRSYRDAVSEKKLRVVSLNDVSDVEFGHDQSLRFRATVVTAPEFQLPEYMNIPVQLPSTTVSEEEVEAALERLRDQVADFNDVTDRELVMGDFAVIDFTGAIGGVPVSEIVPDASRSLHGGKKFWLHVASDNFLPQFCEQVVGMKLGDTRSVQVSFPDDFPVRDLAGKKADYAVTLSEIKQKVLPPMDDAFAARVMPEKTLADLRHTVEHNIEHEKEHEVDRAKETQVVKFLHEHVNFELPQSLLKAETRRALNELVHRNRERGIPDALLKEKEKELIAGAGSLAQHRLKTNFILQRIAERENIQVTRDEIDNVVREQAAHYNVSVEKMRKELEEKDSINGLAEEILLGKALDFLKRNVNVQTNSDPAPISAPPE